MTTQFKVGDRVKHPEYGNGKIVGYLNAQGGGGLLHYLVHFKNGRGHNGDGFDLIAGQHPTDSKSHLCLAQDLTLRPPKRSKIQNGWTPASEPPENVPPSRTNYLRNVEVLLDHSTNIDHAYGFHKAGWHILVGSPSVKQMRSLLFGGWLGQSRPAKEGEVIAWRELPNEEPAPRPFAIGDEVVVEGTIVAIDVDRFVVVYLNGDTESHDPANLKHAEEP